MLFFPQMKPEKRPEISTDDEFAALGVEAAWIPMLRKAGIQTVAALKEANASRLMNELNGLRKKNKLEVPALQLETVESWLK